MNNRYIIFKHKQKLLLVLKSSLLALILAYWYLQSVSWLYVPVRSNKCSNDWNIVWLLLRENIYKAFELVFDNTFTIMSKLFTILDYYSLHETPHSKVIITPHVCYSRFFITLKKFLAVLYLQTILRGCKKYLMIL